MNFAAAALLGLTVGQPPGQDYYPMNSRQIRVPIEYKKERRTLRQVTLYVARNGENTWYQEGFVTPDKDEFRYTAKDDGVYWFKVQTEDLKGNRDPVDLTRDPPDQKLLIDTVKPVVRVTSARWEGDEVVVEWAVDDKFPNDEATRVQFRPTQNPNAPWQDVTLHPKSPNGVRFRSGVAGDVTVRVVATDLAKNSGEVTRDVPAPGASAALPPPNPTPPVIQSPPTLGAARESNPGDTTGSLPPQYRPAWPPGGAGATPIPPPMDLASAGPGPVAPMPPTPPAGGAFTPQPPTPGPVSPPLPSGPATYSPPPSAPLVSPSPGVPAADPAPAGGPRKLATVDPSVPRAAPAVPGNATPAAAWTAGAAPTVEVSRAQVINYPRFHLGFDLEKPGPSGISRVDLWVTRDDGRTWQKWSQHDGKGGSVQVALDVKENAQLEGPYGFKLVPVSGAGLSEREPAAGDTPDKRVVLDVTPPQLELFEPAPDPNAPDILVIQWKAADRNFGTDPITLEWSDSPTGPWKPIAGTGTDPVVQATALNVPAVKKLANTGQYSWRVPAGVPARVYLKATATDEAGNVKPVVTREPILVDLSTPKAKINGIVPPVTPRP